ncbi:AlpA family phage regulatory protein [Agrobacterium tumefaciens]|uniref:helix-turn-helix transcriptional regulator n=1 Tax=Agrobacterium tumefaciens TaxID=358 RepID=UPI0015732185|nr:AlpA family phage regulatory protein [Agrobacterium tumefaciens]NTA69871.1 AlpA family phage regulatory protein [Agrobacterium tumefaciens]
MRFLRVKQVLERVPVGRTTIWRMTETGEFPRSIKIGSSTVWVESEVDEWMRERAQSR